MDQKKPTKGEQTHQAILQAAYELFLEQGFAATSMRQIAQRVGLALSGIYNHFPGKEAIFAQLIIDRHPYQQVLPVLLSTPMDDIEQFVRRSARSMLEELGRRPDFIKLMFIELVEFNGRNMPGVLEQILPKVLPLIVQFERNNLLRPLPPFVVLRAFLGLFFSYYLTEMMLGNLPAGLQQDALDHFTEIFLHGILADKEFA